MTVQVFHIIKQLISFLHQETFTECSWPQAGTFPAHWVNICFSGTKQKKASMRILMTRGDQGFGFTLCILKLALTSHSVSSAMVLWPSEALAGNWAVCPTHRHITKVTVTAPLLNTEPWSPKGVFAPLNTIGWHWFQLLLRRLRFLKLYLDTTKPNYKD